MSPNKLCEPFRLATWPGPGQFASTPYLVEFYKALSPYNVVPIVGLEPRQRWIHAHASTLDGLHIHWPEGLWRKGRRFTVSRAIALLRFWQFCRHAKKLGLKILWTVHNLEPHEGARWIDRRGYQLLADAADVLICHSQTTAEAIRIRYSPRAPVLVMPHGAFFGVYPTPRPREAVLREFGLRDDLPLICCVGSIRAYKGLELACEAMHQLKGSVQLFIGGKPYKKSLNVAALRQLVDSSGMGVLVDRSLTDQEFADVVGASDAVLLPYLHTSGSGVLLTAWTLARGVIASDLPYFREIAASEPDAAQLFEPDNSHALAEAIRQYLTIPVELRTRAAQRAAAKYAWENSIPPVANVFREWQNACREV